jgi:beta-lactamase superfamily II metal-dependent hydrolase
MVRSLGPQAGSVKLYDAAAQVPEQAPSHKERVNRADQDRFMKLQQRLTGYISVTLLVAVGACGGGDPTTPAATPPEITVQGVSDGATYEGPVTIVIGVDRGSYEATLNGQAFSSGGVVSLPGDHRLIVNARAGTATSRQEISFRIAFQGSSLLIVRLIDLGETLGGGGDAILITDSSAAGMVHALVDAGPAGLNGSDPGFVARRLQALGVGELAFLQLTHAHADHFNGMPEVLRSLRVRRFVYNGQVRSLSSYQTVLAEAQQRADSVIVPAGLYTVDLGHDSVKTRTTTIPPLPTFIQQDTGDGTLLNEGSLGTQVRRGGFTMFLTGDGEYQANARWRTSFSTLTRDVTVLKVGHHGANNAIFDAGTTGPSTWLDHTNPEVSVISANGVSHPRLRALTRLLSRTNMRTYCTNVHGTITIRADAAGSYVVTVEKAAEQDCQPGREATT